MKNIYHFTSEENWEKIQKSGFLLPLSNPIDEFAFGLLNIPQEIRDKIKSELYLCSIPAPFPDGWYESGLMESLQNRGNIILKLPLFEKSEGFVREHWPYSPQGYIESCGEDLWTKINKEPITICDGRYHEGSEKYIKSTVLLKDYKNNYRTPELWAPQKTPVGLIKRIK
jgi:hypothetical protein